MGRHFRSDKEARKNKYKAQFARTAENKRRHIEKAKKKSLKVCAVLLFVFSLFGLSSFISLDVSATRYQYDKLMLGGKNDYFTDDSGNIYLWFASAGEYSYDSDGVHVSSDVNKFPYFGTSSDLRAWILYGDNSDPEVRKKRAFPTVSLYDRIFDNSGDPVSCSLNDQIIGNLAGGSPNDFLFYSNISNFSYFVKPQNQWQFLAAGNGQNTGSILPNLYSVIPCRYVQSGQDPAWVDWSSVYLYSKYRIDGVITNTHEFSFSEYAGYSSGKFYGAAFPLDFNIQKMGGLASGRQLEWRSNFIFRSPIVLSNNEQAGVLLQYRGFTSDYKYKSGFVDCSSLYRIVEASEYYALEVTCPLTPDEDYVYFEPQLVYYPYLDADMSDWPDSANSGIFSFTEDFVINMYLITDGDDSDDGGAIGLDDFGYDTDSAPGNAEDRDSFPGAIAWGTDDVVGFLDHFWENIFSLFAFNLFNPFSGFFTAFTDGGSCVNIPILAGMIHSNESQVCPWFNPAVRQLGTPVFTIASSMILFGFIIRWFKSTSNDFSPTSSGGLK